MDAEVALLPPLWFAETGTLRSACGPEEFVVLSEVQQHVNRRCRSLAKEFASYERDHIEGFGPACATAKSRCAELAELDEVLSQSLAAARQAVPSLFSVEINGELHSTMWIGCADPSHVNLAHVVRIAVQQNKPSGIGSARLLAVPWRADCDAAFPGLLLGQLNLATDQWVEGEPLRLPCGRLFIDQIAAERCDRATRSADAMLCRVRKIDISASPRIVEWGVLIAGTSHAALVDLLPEEADRHHWFAWDGGCRVIAVDAAAPLSHAVSSAECKRGVVVYCVPQADFASPVPANELVAILLQSLIAQRPLRLKFVPEPLPPLMLPVGLDWLVDDVRRLVSHWLGCEPACCRLELPHGIPCPQPVFLRGREPLFALPSHTLSVVLRDPTVFVRQLRTPAQIPDGCTECMVAIVTCTGEACGDLLAWIEPGDTVATLEQRLRRQHQRPALFVVKLTKCGNCVADLGWLSSQSCVTLCKRKAVAVDCERLLRWESSRLSARSAGGDGQVDKGLPLDAACARLAVTVRIVRSLAERAGRGRVLFLPLRIGMSISGLRGLLAHLLDQPSGDNVVLFAATGSRGQTFLLSDIVLQHGVPAPATLTWGSGAVPQSSLEVTAVVRGDGVSKHGTDSDPA